MRKNKDLLKIILITLIAIFLMVGIAAILLAGHKKSLQKEQKKQAALEALQNVPTAAPTPSVTVTPTPVPTATPTPTPVPTRKPAFNPDDYWNEWYSTDGLAAIDIYAISEKSVSFYFSQANKKGTRVAEADVTAEVAGNAAKLSFTDSFGSTASGNMIFDKGQLFVKITTTAQAEGASVSPSVNCVMTREQPDTEWDVEIPEPTAAPEPQPTPTPQPDNNGQQTPSQTGDYYFPESDSRYLTDDEISSYSSSDLELAKNEIYARHGRQFVTERIADYFKSKPWYQGTIDPETFDAQQDSIFNEYEIANIGKIAEWEQKKRSEGN
ncbi:MAG: YARHG domain-containing protein [Eubacteriales bacterium]|nr:YARHG domain-containing protein [Eubacteriales bacterium]